MKQGILITAYKNFEHLLDIVSFFDERFEIYIHIDKKSVINEGIIETIRSLPQVKLVSRKYKVNWGGINHLKCILHLAEEALKSKELQTFHLISGHDYPIKDCSYFIDFFKKKGNNNYLSHFEMPLKQWANGGMDRLEFYNLYDVMDAKKYRHYIFKFVKLQSKLNIKRSISKKIPKLYGGETWWSLSWDTLNYVLNYSKQNTFFLKRLQHSFCSEEIYFQTVIMNSKYAVKTINDSLRYIDWDSRNGNLPANLDLNDLENLKNTNKLFARKFDFPVSNELKQCLSNQLKGL